MVEVLETQVKPATYQETTEIVTAWASGKLKALLAIKCMTYHCAMMRITRYRREYPADYRRACKMLTIVNCAKRRRLLN